MIPHPPSDNGYVCVTVKYRPFSNGGGQFLVAAIKLLDFDIEGARLKTNHEMFIAHYASLLSAIPGSQFFVLGDGGLSGTARPHLPPLRWRADAVLKALWDYGADPKRIAVQDGVGNSPAAKGQAYHDRVVEILVTCPPSSREQLAEFEANWNADPWRLRSQEPHR